MIDLTREMGDLAQRLETGTTELGRVVQFSSALSGEGVSTVAREFARYLAERARRGVWLVELDLLKGDQFATVKAAPTKYGALGPPVRSSIDGSMFFDVAPKLLNANEQPWPNAGYLDAYPVGARRWWITRFRREALKPGQNVRILSSPDYWYMLRKYADYVIVDAPSLQRSRAALAIAAHVNDNVLVIAGDRNNVDSAVILKDGLISAGGRCTGIVFNRAKSEPPRFLQALVP